MIQKAKTSKLLALILSVLLLFAGLPLAALAQTGQSDFVPENLFQTQLESSHEAVLQNMTAEVSDGKGGWTDSARFNSRGALAASVDGDLTTPTDFYAYNETSKNFIGARYHLKAAYFCGDLKIFSGSPDNKDVYRVYASETLDKLYDNDSLVTDNAVCDGKGTTIAINRKVQYISLFLDNIKTTAISGSDHIGRVIEFQLFTGDEANTFVPENLFQGHLESSHEAVLKNGISEASDGNGGWKDDPRFDLNGALAASVDGNLKATADIWSYDAKNPSFVGARYHLDAAYFCGELKIFSGFPNLKDVYRVYASETLDTLYNADSLVTDNAVCDGSGTVVTINRKIQYISIFLDNLKMGELGQNNSIGRVYEFQLFTGDESAAVIPKNLLQTKKESEKLVHMFMNSGNVGDGTKFDQNGALAAATDGNVTDKKAVYDCIGGWDNPVYPGVVYTLSETAPAGHLMLFLSGKVKAYASDRIDNLYSKTSCVADELECSATGTKVELNRNVKYIAIFCVGYADVAEIQLWSTEPDNVQDPDTSLKVLTIGNSFAENASVYASEIAAANNLSLTFGYLKFPSCRIDQHYEAAQNNKAVFKFEITDPTGHRTTIKNQAASWDAPDPANCATIEEALNYMNWDVVVFQQESYSSNTESTFAELPNLIQYVKGIRPDAKLMIHEVWAWGDWKEDDTSKNFSNIKANYEKAAKENNLTIIPSGLGFEYAREALGSRTIVNEDDGYHQHANSYGQYIAGCCYVGALFDTQIAADTFKTHPEVNKESFVETLTESANKALLYYDGCVDGNHTFAEIAKAEFLKTAATCISKAVYYKSCSACGEKSTETFEYGDVDATKHGETEVRNAVDATEDSDGYTGDTYCKDCNQKIADGTSIPALGHTHNMNAVAAKDATCTTAGNKAYWQCTKCQKYYSDENGTTEITLASTVIEKLDHSFTVLQKDAANHWHKCATCDATDTAQPHSGGTATCTKKAVCSVCSTEYGSTDASKHGETEVRDAVAATEDNEGYTGDTYCKDCGQKIADGQVIPKLDHTHQLTKTEAKPATHTEAGNHEYYFCSVCKKYYKESNAVTETTLEEMTIPKGEHSYSDQYSSDGTNHWKECSCGDKTESAAHTFGEFTVTKPATETEKGSQKKTCSVCGYEYVEEIPALGGEPTPPSEPEKVELKSDDSNITITTTTEKLDPNVKLVTEPVDAKDSGVSNWGGYQEKTAVIFEIYLEKDGEKIQPNGKVTVSIPIPEALKGLNCKVLYIDATGKIVDMNAVQENGQMIFETNHFSLYAVVASEGGAAQPPKTSENSSPFAVIFLVFGLATVLICNRKLRVK